METLERIITKVNEFVARDALYIAAGVAIMISSMTHFGLTAPAIFEAAKETSNIHSMLVLVAIIIFAIFTYYLGLINRELYRVCYLVAVSSRPWYKKKFVAKIYENISGREAPSFEINVREVLDSLLYKEVKMHKFSRQVEEYKRAIFLKEIASTIGSAIVTSSILIFLGVNSERPQDSAELIWFITLAAGLLGCLLSHYLFIREAKIAEDLLALVQRREESGSTVTEV